MDRGNLSSLADAVADDRHVEWGSVESSAWNENDLEPIRQLRKVAELLQAARRLGSRWGPFELRGEIGRGSFGTVYRAWDPRLNVEVALKLLPTGLDYGRALREGQLLAQVRHPNVVSVYGADVVNGQVGFWMELVEGRTLKQIIQEHGPFSAHEASLIGRDLSRALTAVHQKGIIHRDLKAQNVMRGAGGRVVLMDFGTSLVTSGDVFPTPGLSGTPFYLAPELLEGEPPTVASDLYSLGVLLFHLVSGEFPVGGDSLVEISASHRNGVRRLISDARPGLPLSFIRVVDIATAPNPLRRPRTAGELEALLDNSLSEDPTLRPSQERRRVAYFGAAAVAIFLGALSWTWRPPPPVPSVRSLDSVAVLPFRNLADENEDYFTAGLTEDLSTQLSAIRSIRVVAGPTTRRYTAAGKSEREIAADLDVASIVSGSVRRSGDHLRVVSTLIDATTGNQLWAGSFDREMGSVLVLQAEVARQIAVALQGDLSLSDAQRLESGARRDPSAFNSYIRGRYYWGLRTEDGLNKAVTYFNDAIYRDRGYALAYAGLADAYAALGAYGYIARIEAAPMSYSAAERAVALDPTLPEAHAALGYAQKNRFEWSASESSYRKAIELSPNYASAHHFYAILLTQLGRFSEALAEAKRALALDPMSIAANATVPSALLMARRYDDAIAGYDYVLKLDPAFRAAYKGSGTAYVHKGNYEQAATRYKKAVQLAPLAAEDQEVKADLGYLAAVSGQRADAVRIIAELTRRHDKAGEAVAVSVAAIYSGLQDLEQAFTWLQKAHSRSDPELGYLKVDPRWDSLRDDRRFSTLLASLRLSD